jgi:methyltransferase
VQIIYPAFVLFILLESLVEAAISRKNSSALIARGAIEVAPYLLPLMVLLYLFQFVGSVFEYYKAAREVSLNWLIIFGSIVLAAKVLKFWAISSLGSFWTMKVLIVPGSQAVTNGPYRWIRHPNYIAVVTESLALPLMGKAYITTVGVALIFSCLLFLRIRAEEQALMQYTDYSKTMATKRRFIP